MIAIGRSEKNALPVCFYSVLYNMRTLIFSIQDFTTNPPILRNSVPCQKAPNNSELNGVVQAQDSANDPDIFFDPATGKSVGKGGQPNTFPVGSVNNTRGRNGNNNASSK